MVNGGLVSQVAILETTELYNVIHIPGTKTQTSLTTVLNATPATLSGIAISINMPKIRKNPLMAMIMFGDKNGIVNPSAVLDTTKDVITSVMYVCRKAQ